VLSNNPPFNFLVTDEIGARHILEGGLDRR